MVWVPNQKLFEAESKAYESKKTLGSPDGGDPGAIVVAVVLIVTLPVWGPIYLARAAFKGVFGDR